MDEYYEEIPEQESNQEAECRTLGEYIALSGLLVILITLCALVY